MQVKWRQYELIFALSLFLLIGAREMQQFLFSQPPSGSVTATHLVTDAVLPFLLMCGVPLLLLILINWWLLPRYLHHRHNLIILPAAAILCWAIVTVAFAGSYSIRFNYLYKDASTATVMRLGAIQSLGAAGGVILSYVLYLCAREPLIQIINQPGEHRAFRILLANRITAAALLYTGVLVFLVVFKLTRSDVMGMIYIFILLPVIIIVFINLYGLFPWRHRRQPAFSRFAAALLIAPLVFSVLTLIVYALLSGALVFLIVPVQTVILATIATPISWILFNQQKDKLFTILQLKKDLGKTTADLAFLRSQINPHFLFNTLNTLYGTALQENAQRTATGVQRLGDMMRFLLHDNHRHEIPLSRELEYLKNYMALQQLRIDQSHGITIETSIHECTTDRLIAPMLLIPFIENAFKHGIRLTSPSFIRIHFHCDQKGIYLDVVNSIHPKRNEAGLAGESGVGLQNVQQRLQLIYPGTHNLTIHQDDAAFEVHLHIALPELN